MILYRVGCVLLLVAFLCCLPPTFAEPRSDAESAGRRKSPGRYALLIGCTHYPNHAGVHELYGPRNDVATFRETLIARFGFEPANIQQLVGGSDDPQSEPTRANIARAFEQLVARSQPGDQIFVLLSGHGVQAPIPSEQQDALAPSNPEPDGLDEVFLPSDFAGWKDGQLVNAVKDDQVGAWLEEIRQRGADVWAVFDCCHSGTMSRGLNDGEIHRGVGPWDVGVPREALEEAARKAHAAQGAERPRGPSSEASVELRPELAESQTALGHITAFYAAQAFETAPELPRPAHAPRTPEHYHGLLSYVLTQVLSQSPGPLTYQELSNAIITQYRAERGSRAPTPFFDGSMSRTVLSAEVRQAPAMVLQHQDGKLLLNAGELMGVGKGTVLACSKAADRPDEDEKLLGHVQVVEVTATSAQLEPCAFGEYKAVPPSQLPELTPCRIVAKTLGDMRVTVALRPPAQPQQPAANDILIKAVTKLRGERPELLDVVADETAADWLLQWMDPAQAHEAFKRETAEPLVFLLQSPRLASATGVSVAGQRVFGQYRTADVEMLVRDLERDFQKIFTWHNVWRIAGALEQPVHAALKLELNRINSSEAPGVITNLRPGDRIEIRVANQGLDDLTVTLLFLDGNFGISEWVTTAVRAGESLQPIRVVITDETTGTEGFCVLAQRLAKKALAPNYAVLVQEPLGVTNRSIQTAEPARTPFGRLLQTAATGKGLRAAMLEAPDTPEILAKSWVTLPRAE